MLTIKIISDDLTTPGDTILSRVRSRQHSERLPVGERLEELLHDKNALEEAIRTHHDDIERLINPQSDSPLSLARRWEILRQIMDDNDQVSKAIEKARHRTAKKEADRIQANPDLLNQSPWATVATTPPVKIRIEQDRKAAFEALIQNTNGHQKILQVQNLVDESFEYTVQGLRASIAFHKGKCEFQKNKKGCLFCALSGGDALYAVTPENMLASFNDSLERTRPQSPMVMEILPDGSFINAAEVPEAVQNKIMEMIAKESFLRKVAIETRPEYLTAERIKDLLVHLRPDQKLEIYSGVETTESFVASFIHDKGYSFEEWEESMTTCWKGLTETEQARVSFTAYNLMKPAYLTDQESIQLSRQMSQSIANLRGKYNIPIEMKVEPTVISEGTVQKWLYDQKTPEGERRFEALSYFSVAELLAQAILDGNAHFIKFGQRDDIDPFSVVAHVPHLAHTEMFSPYDFLVYYAVQNFNSTREIKDFITCMRQTVASKEFELWEQSTGGGKGTSALSKLCNDASIENNQETLNFQAKIWDICDIFEYLPNLCSIARTTDQNSFKPIVEKVFIDKNITVISVNNMQLLEQKEKPCMKDKDPKWTQNVHADYKEVKEGALLQVEIIIEDQNGLPQSVWVAIPMTENLDYIRPTWIEVALQKQ